MGHRARGGALGTAAQSVTRFAVHPGVYKDSLVLMQLQQRLLERPGVLDAGAAMASAANLELLAARALLPDSVPRIRGEDLLVVVRAESDETAEDALDRLVELLATRHTTEGGSFRPRSLDGVTNAVPRADRGAYEVDPGDGLPRPATAIEWMLSRLSSNSSLPRPA